VPENMMTTLCRSTVVAKQRAKEKVNKTKMHSRRHQKKNPINIAKLICPVLQLSVELSSHHQFALVCMAGLLLTEI